MINFSLLIYNSIQANPVIGCAIYGRPYRSFYRPSCHLWCPAKKRRCHLRHCLVKDAYWRAAVEIWTQRTDLPRLGKQGEEPGILSGMGLPMRQRQLWCIERVLEEKDNFLGTETVKGKLSSQETVIYLADLSVKLKSCKVFYTSVCTSSSEAYFIKLCCFHVIYLIRPFWVLFLCFKPKSLCDVFESYRE